MTVKFKLLSGVIVVKLVFMQEPQNQAGCENLECFISPAELYNT